MPADPTHVIAPVLWETRWLEFLVRGSRDDETLGEAEALARTGGDWHRLIRRFSQEALIPHADRLLRRLPSGCVPQEALDALHRHVVQHAARSLLSIEQLSRAMQALISAGISTLTLKGPALGQAAYGDPLARAYVDIDLLVPRSKRHHAAAVLARQGYSPEWTVAPGAASFLRHSCSVAFKHVRTGDLDLHWGFSTPLMPFALDRTGLCSRTREADLGRFTARTLGPEDTLLHACVHAARDDWIYWRAHADVAALLTHADDLDWRLLRHLARQTGSTRMLRIGLLLALHRARARLPTAIVSWARSDPRAVGRALDYQQTLESGRAASQGTLRRVMRAVGLRERAGDKALTALGALARASEPRAGESWAPWTWPLRRPLRLVRDLRADERPPLGGQSP